MSTDKNKGVVKAFNEIWEAATTSGSSYEKWKNTNANAYLNNQQIEECCALCERAGAHYVKTSTGFASSGAKLEDVHLMVQCCDGRLKVKSAGGVRTLDQLLAFMEAGVTRSGASSTKAMLDEYKERWGSGTE